MAIYHMMGEQDIETALRFPWTSIGSDAGAILKYGEPDETGLPHPRSFGNFPRVIARYVKERRVLTLEDAIRKMTSWPATRLRLANRGAIREDTPPAAQVAAALCAVGLAELSSRNAAGCATRGVA